MNPAAGNNKQDKRRRAIILAAVVVGALTIIGSIIALTVSSSQNRNNGDVSGDAEQSEGVATVEGFTQNISELKASLDKAKASSDVTKAALKNSGSPTAGNTTAAKLKDAITKEVDQRSKLLDDSLKSLRATTVAKEAANATPDNPQVTQAFKNSVQERTESVALQLRNTKTKLATTSSLAELQTLARAVDSQAVLAQVVHVQTVSTKAAIDFQELVTQLKTADTDLLAQIAKIKECARGTDDNAGSGVSSSGCEEFTISSEDGAVVMERKLEAVRLSTETISSTVSSATMLLTTLSANLESVLTQLGDINKLGDISKQTKAGNMNGLVLSFTALDSQLMIAHGLSEAALIELASIFDQMTG